MYETEKANIKGSEEFLLLYMDGINWHSIKSGRGRK